jgi:putative hydrolase of the HAD superfamily
VDVVFDFGNVLVEWNPQRLVREHFAHALPAGASVEAFVKTLVNEDWVAYDHGEIDLQTMAERLAPKLECSEAELAAFVARIPHVLPSLDTAISAMQALCDARDRGVALRVLFLSNMPRDFADVLERRFDWIARFDGGIFSGRNRLSKPDPSIYEALESRYALQPGRTLFFDDSVPNIETALARGWRAVRVNESTDVIRGLTAHGLHAPSN